MKNYSWGAIFKFLFFLGLLVFAMIISEGAGILLVLPFALYALVAKRNNWLMFVFLALGTMVVVNKNIVPKGIVFWLVQRGTLALLAAILSVSIVSVVNSQKIRPLLGMILYVAYMMIPSSFGWSPVVSFFKLMLFLGVFMAYYGLANRIALCSKDSIAQLRSVVLTFAIFYIVGSVAVYPFPSIGQLSGEEYLDALRSGNEVTSLFMGMTTHSQCLGPIISSLAVLLLADMLFSIKRLDPLYVLLLSFCPILVYLTSSRTALGTLFVGVMFVFWCFYRDRGGAQKWRNRIATLVIVGCVALGFAVVAIPQLRDGALNFLLKRAEGVRVSDISFDSVTSSRQSLTESALYNFRQSPFIGNGFQVSESMVGVRRDSILSLLSAPVEKGLWVTAVLEEGGVLGFILISVFFLMVIALLIRRRAYIGASTFVVLITANMGEFCMFSMSYTGGFLWAMVFVGLILDHDRCEPRPYLYGNCRLGM